MLNNPSPFPPGQVARIHFTDCIVESNVHLIEESRVCVSLGSGMTPGAETPSTAHTSHIDLPTHPLPTHPTLTPDSQTANCNLRGQEVDLHCAQPLTFWNLLGSIANTTFSNKE